MKAQFICLALAATMLCPHASAQWVNINVPRGSPVCLAVSGTNLFVGTIWGGGGVFLSTNNGTTWTAVNNGLPRTPYDTTQYAGVDCLALSGQNLFAETDDPQGVFLSTNSGTTWTAASTPFLGFICMVQMGLNLFAGTSSGVFLSTNNGTSWTAGNSGFPQQVEVYRFAVSGTNLFAGTDRGVFLSTNNGTSWTAVNEGLPRYSHDTTRYAPVRLSLGGTNLFAKTYDPEGVFLSTNNGTSWTVFTTEFFPDLAISNSTLFAVARWDVFISTDGGKSWRGTGCGLVPGDLSFACLALSGAYLFAFNYRSLLRRPLSEMITSAGPALSELPTQFSLEQNFPNPFNPTTKIQFTIANRRLTIVKVYDVLGRDVATLVNEVKDPGTYTVDFDGSHLSSGVYFNRLQAGDFIQTHKMILVR
jgi:hypothetical protein